MQGGRGPQAEGGEEKTPQGEKAEFGRYSSPTSPRRVHSFFLNPEKNTPSKEKQNNKKQFYLLPGPRGRSPDPIGIHASPEDHAGLLTVWP